MPMTVEYDHFRMEPYDQDSLGNPVDKGTRALVKFIYRTGSEDWMGVAAVLDRSFAESLIKFLDSNITEGGSAPT